MANPIVLILIPFYGNIDLLNQCVASISQCKSKYTYRLLLVNDATPAEEMNQLQDGDYEMITLETNTGFTNAVNTGLRENKDSFDYVILLNSDMKAMDGCFDALIDRAKADKNIGIVGGIELSHLNADYIINAGGNQIVSNGRLTDFLSLVRKGRVSDGDYQKAEMLDWVAFGVVLLTAACVNCVGELDCQFINYFSDVDYCKQASLNSFTIWFEPAARVVHKQHMTSKLFLNRSIIKLQEERERFYKKWYPRISYYHIDDRFWNIRIGASAKKWFPKILPHFDFLHFFNGQLNSFLNTDNDILEKVNQVKQLHITDDPAVFPWDVIKELYLKGYIYLKQVSSLYNATEEDVFSYQQEELTIFSPHCDDVALSLSGFLLRRKSYNENSVVNVLFGKSNYTIQQNTGLTVDEVSRIRSIEEAQLCSELNINFKIFKLSDTLIRRPGVSIYYDSVEDLERSITGRCMNTIMEVVNERPESMIVAPLAASLMSDHTIVAFSIAYLVSKGKIDSAKVLIYEDLPYAGMSGGLAKGIALYAYLGIELEPIVYDISAVFESKRELLSVYYSQLGDYHREIIDQYGYSIMRLHKGPTLEEGRRGERLWKIKSVNKHAIA
jgi:GT2 family glycosyltransferase/LmbE family N-acetylglucosaminyl deacetylase